MPGAPGKDDGFDLDDMDDTYLTEVGCSLDETTFGVGDEYLTVSGGAAAMLAGSMDVFAAGDDFLGGVGGDAELYL